jgi:hypothetical protein
MIALLATRLDAAKVRTVTSVIKLTQVSVLAVLESAYGHVTATCAASLDVDFDAINSLDDDAHTADHLLSQRQEVWSLGAPLLNAGRRNGCIGSGFGVRCRSPPTLVPPRAHDKGTPRATP